MISFFDYNNLYQIKLLQSQPTREAPVQCYLINQNYKNWQLNQVQ